jgi:hypothetical protein
MTVFLPVMFNLKEEHITLHRINDSDELPPASIRESFQRMYSGKKRLLRAQLSTWNRCGCRPGRDDELRCLHLHRYMEPG